MRQAQKSNWQFFEKQQFEYQSDYKDYLDPTCSWIRHIQFAYDLIANIKPKVFVELGTYLGTSFFSFLQAIKDFDLDTKAFAIDTWKGEEHTGFYGKEVFDQFQTLQKKHYGKINARILKMTFDEALKEFEGGSINLLHIDGLHTYDAVKHDYKGWQSKLAKDHVILFHDTKVANFGVWKLWEELKSKDSDSIYLEFKHGYGLGVIFRGQYIDIGKDLEKSNFQKYYENKSIQFLGQSLEPEVKHFKDVSDENQSLLSQKEYLEKKLLDNSTQLINLKKSIENSHDEITSQQKQINDLKKSVNDSHNQIASQQQNIQQLELVIKDQEKRLTELKNRKIIRLINFIKREKYSA